MVRARGNLVCPKCGEVGGTLTLRKAGNPNSNGKYYYIQHYEGTRKRQCYIGRRRRLSFIRLVTPRYDQYLEVMQNADDEYCYDFLTSFGWPEKYVREKIIADRHQAEIQRIPSMSNLELLELDERLLEERKKIEAELRLLRDKEKANTETTPASPSR